MCPYIATKHVSWVPKIYKFSWTNLHTSSISIFRKIQTNKASKKKKNEDQNLIRTFVCRSLFQICKTELTCIVTIGNIAFGQVGCLLQAQ